MRSAGRPKVWTAKRISALADLFDRFLAKDPFFEDEVFSEIAEVVPTLAHFIATIHIKWAKVKEDYPDLKGVDRPPAKSTILEIEELSDRITAVKTIQERGLLYGALSGQLSNSVASLMLQDHGYVRRSASEVSGPDGGAVTVQIIDDIG